MKLKKIVTFLFLFFIMYSSALASDIPNVVFVGKTSAGKSTIIQKLIQKDFEVSTQPTRRTEAYKHQDVQIFDTKGITTANIKSRDFSSVNDVLQTSDFVFIVYDLSKENPDESLCRFLDSMLKTINCKIIILGNKFDMIKDDSDKIENHIRILEEFKKNNMCDWFLISAKDKTSYESDFFNESFWKLIMKFKKTTSKQPETAPLIPREENSTQQGCFRRFLSCFCF